MFILKMNKKEMEIVRAALETYLEQEKEYASSNFDSIFEASHWRDEKKKIDPSALALVLDDLLKDGFRIGMAEDLLRKLPTTEIQVDDQ